MGLRPQGQEGPLQVKLWAELQQDPELGSGWYVRGNQSQSGVCTKQEEKVFWSKIPRAPASTEVVNSYFGVPAMTQE